MRQWFGFDQEVFEVDGCEAWIAYPRRPLPGRQWVWCLEFPGGYGGRTGSAIFCHDGFHYVHVRVGDTFGCPRAQETFDLFYEELRRRGFAEKGILVGISRGGLYAYRFASRRPEAVAGIYGDAPVCDFKSWPGGFRRTGSGYERVNPENPAWERLKKLYGFASDGEALAYDRNPVDLLPPLAAAGIPLFHVVGDADTVVPVADNTAVVEARYKALGGRIEVYHKTPAAGVMDGEEIPDAADPHLLRASPAGCGHHPHGLLNPVPILRFAREAVGAGN